MMGIPGGSILGVGRTIIADVDLKAGDVVYLNASGHAVKGPMDLTQFFEALWLSAAFIAHLSDFDEVDRRHLPPNKTLMKEIFLFNFNRGLETVSCLR